jgi:hypothetical protein
MTADVECSWRAWGACSCERECPHEPTDEED